MTEAVWSSCLSSAGSRSMRAARIACTVAGTSIARQRPGQTIGAALPGERPGLDQRPDALLEEERVALGPLDQQSLERAPAPASSPRSALRSSPALSGGSASSRSWRVVGLAAPAVLVLGPVVHQQQDPGRRQALDQAVEQRLRLGIDPVQVLEDHEQRLLLALPEQEPLDGVEGALPALGRIERLPGGVLDGHVEQGQQGRQGRLQRPIQRQELAGHLLADLARGSRDRSIPK